jgi:putative heme-binding domain-containing protein
MSKKGVASAALELRQGLFEPTQRALRIIEDETVRTSLRLEYLQVIGEVKVPDAVTPLLALFEKSTNSAVRGAVLGALQHYDDSEIGLRVVNRYPSLEPGLWVTAGNLLASRESWSNQLLDAVEAGKILSNAVPASVVGQIRLHHDPALLEKVNKVWGTVRERAKPEMEKQINDYAAVIRNEVGDPYSGRKLFEATCAQCHTLFGKGGQAGPDLTPFKRNDLPSLLLSIVNPSAEIREGFEAYAVETSDDRSLTGFLADKDSQVIVLRGLDGRTLTIPRKDIASMRSSNTSLMPEGLLVGMSEQQVRDLFAYLRSSQPLIGDSVSSR